MEVYVAVSDFISPNCEGSQNILSFRRGDKFEIFDCHKSSSEWWGARALSNNSVGYVPSKYMKFEDRKIGSVLPETNKVSKMRERERESLPKFD
ncbi:hypothetical protein FSP39_015695 [Pinctada imbricata]|uniref:SH3 domain-containing protein n=1 Tax=Pinctada imbricata TaxID=66713 RepID=A0AA88YDY0_PINIB|nr:hypothetical protein FSP39_015695 [Pinctada imbricata]